MAKACKYLFITISLLIWFLAILIYNQIEYSFEEIELPNTQAKCWDGSNYKFLFSPGETNSTSFLFYFESGGFCGDQIYSNTSIFPSCHARTWNKLGTNKFTFITRYYFSYFSRLLSSNSKYNPHFYSWNKIIIKYCDGAIFRGNNTGWMEGLYSRGEANVMETLEYLKQKHSFQDYSNIVISGSSAGGMAALSWAKYIFNWKPDVPSSNKTIISDSGYMWDMSSELNPNSNALQDMMKRLVNQLNITNTDAMSNYCKYSSLSEERWKCFIPKYFIEEWWEYNLLILHSQYDSWALNRIIGSGCFFDSFGIYVGCNATEISAFDKHAELLVSNLKSVSMKGRNFIAWLPKGFFHTFIYLNWNWDNDEYSVNGVTLNKAIEMWIEKKDNKLVLYDKEVKGKQFDIYWVSMFFNKISQLVY